MNVSNYGKLSFQDKLIRQKMDRYKILHFFIGERFVFFSSFESALLCSRSSVQRKLFSLEKQGIIKSDSLPLSTEFYGNKTMKIYSLTNNGLEYAKGLIGDEFNFLSFDKSRINLTTLKHTFIIQQVKARYNKQGYDMTYPSFDIKIADGYINKLNVCVEVELNIKNYARYNEIIGEYIYLMGQGETKIKKIHYIVSEEVYKNRLKKIFSSFSTINVRDRILKIDAEIFNIFEIYTVQEYYDHINKLENV